MSSPLPFSVSAPASSGNLGPGFDVLAMALELRNVIKVTKGSGTIHVTGHGADELPTGEDNLVARAFRQAAGTSIAAAGVDLHCENRIPMARGLGSSTAAAACGLIAGWHHAGREWDDDDLFNELTRLDGHPDNAAACAYGGVVVCLASDDPEPEVVTLGAAEWITPIVFVPERTLETARAREVLPETYTRHEAVRAIGAAGLLVGGLVGGHPELVADALHLDVLHEPQRAALVPELAEVREAVAATRALGATLSGAGPSVLVWCTPDAVEQTHGSLSIDFPDAELLELRCAAAGARVED